MKGIKVILKKRKAKINNNGRESYKNFPEVEKQRLVEYRKEYYKKGKNKNPY